MGEQLQYICPTPISRRLGVSRLAVSRLPLCCTPTCNLHESIGVACCARVHQLYVTLRLDRNGSLLEYWQRNNRAVGAHRTSLTSERGGETLRKSYALSTRMLWCELRQQVVGSCTNRYLGLSRRSFSYLRIARSCV